MKKILTTIIFGMLCLSMNAQNVVDRQTIKNSPNELGPFVQEDIELLGTVHENLDDDQKKALNNLYYYKYKTLTADLTEAELVELTNSIKERSRIIFGDTLYLEIAQNQNLFNRLTGLVYLTQ